MPQRPRAISVLRAETLRPILDRFLAAYDAAGRLRFDPIELPKRYRDPADVEVVALLATALAYGRADLFKPQIEVVLSAMGARPARFAEAFWQNPSAAPFQRFHYRFNRPADIAALIAAIGWMRETHGGLGVRFASLFARSQSIRATLSGFSKELREAPPVTGLLEGRGKRGLSHLCPDPDLSGACKRWNLYLRWMVRGPDAVDFGIWRGVPRSALMIPLDTHVARIARYLGLTDRSDMTWRTAAEISDNLRRIDPDDPIRYDFALCHLGMSGACPPQRRPERCAACALITQCRARSRQVPLPHSEASPLRAQPAGQQSRPAPADSRVPPAPAR